MTDEQRLDYIKSQIDSKQFISWKDAQFLLDRIDTPTGTRMIDDPDGLGSSGPLPDKPWTEWSE